MSDIGRLFHKIGTAQQTPIENFTTEALAIAIEHDDAPMRRALKAIVWPSTSRVDAEHLVRVECRTQQYLPAAGTLREGYLDLVLALAFESGETVTVWVEVKVESPENMPTTPGSRHRPRFIAVNNRIRELWPTYEIAWPGKDSRALMTAARAEFAKSNRIVATGGPLTYGLVPVEGSWTWSISVGSANYQRVRIDPAHMVRDADHRGLSARWKRLGQRHAALQAGVSLAECSGHEDVTSWFVEALRELDEKKILGSFWDGLDAKRAKSMSSGS